MGVGHSSGDGEPQPCTCAVSDGVSPYDEVLGVRVEFQTPPDVETNTSAMYRVRLVSGGETISMHLNKDTTESIRTFLREFKSNHMATQTRTGKAYTHKTSGFLDQLCLSIHVSVSGGIVITIAHENKSTGLFKLSRFTCVPQGLMPLGFSLDSLGGGAAATPKAAATRSQLVTMKGPRGGTSGPDYAAAVLPSETLPTPVLSSQDPTIFNPEGLTTVFEPDLLIISHEPGTKTLPGDTVMQFLLTGIREVNGSRHSQPYWVDARTTVWKGSPAWCFFLPSGNMNVQVRCFSPSRNLVSPASKAYPFLINGK